MNDQIEGVELVGTVDRVPPSKGRRAKNPETIFVVDRVAGLKDGQILKFCFPVRNKCNSANWAVRRLLGLKTAERLEADGRRALYVWREPPAENP